MNDGSHRLELLCGLRRAFAAQVKLDALCPLVMAKRREVGGDFCDFLLVDGARVGVLIGNVSGKGVPAACPARGVPQSDDLPALALRYRGRG